MSTEPIVVERTIKASPERVWRAITSPREMKQWFFEPMEDFRPEVGFETKFVVNSGEKDFLHHWRVTEAVPNQKLVYDWLYPAYPGASVVTWDVSPAGDATVLRLTHEGSSSFPQTEPAFTRTSCHGGWEYFMNRLAEFAATR